MKFEDIAEFESLYQIPRELIFSNMDSDSQVQMPFTEVIAEIVEQIQLFVHFSVSFLEHNTELMHPKLDLLYISLSVVYRTHLCTLSTLQLS